MTEHGIRWPHLVVVGLTVAALASALLLLSARAGNPEPQANWVTAVLTALFCGFVVAAALPVRRIARGTAPVGKEIGMLRAARTLVLAQASAMTGAALTGGYLALAARWLGDLDVPGHLAALVAALSCALAGAGLLAAGLVAQRLCRRDGDPPKDLHDEG